MDHLIKDTKIYHCSTSSNSGQILNTDINYKSNIKYDFPSLELLNDDNVEYVNFSVPYAVIPTTMYNIDYTNQQLDVSLNGVISSYVFESGNYSVNDFISDFFSILGTTWTITIDTATSMFTISNSTSPFQLLSTSTICQVMGFSTTQTSTTDSVLINKVTLPKSCNFFLPSRIHLRCKDLANSFQVGNPASSSSQSSSDIICTVLNDAPINSQIVYRNISMISYPIQLQNINSFTIFITDDNNNLINFNGISASFALQFDIYRRKAPKQEKKFKQLLQELNDMINS